MLSTEIWVVICVALLILKYLVLEPIEDKKIYKMFESRDNVALKAYRNELDQDSEEYKYVINTINFELYYMKNDYDFFIILNNLLRDPYQRRKKLDSLFKKIRSNKDLNDAFKVAYETFVKQLNFRVLVFNVLVIVPIYVVLWVTVTIINALEKLAKNIQEISVGVLEAYRKVKRETDTCFNYLRRNPYKL